ncbi:S8 family serine peptidase [Anaeromyxobacter sp. SG66]|uniref:S8 family serine peptidase n=1 Tax=Anaeromyxobacter sp. SG66 TaxID=2925410 RepID=UPI00272C81AE|nr:S8 family serine peptidase [Anaeromyxobacter sp. SG66]
MAKKNALLLLPLLALASRALADDVVALEPSGLAPSAETGALVDESAHLWFVELASPPTSEGSSLATVRAQKSAFRAAAAKAGVRYSERFSFDVLFNGVSVSVPPAQLGRLARIAGVKAVYPVETIAMPEPAEVSEPDLLTAIAMTGADAAQEELGFTGRGVKVGVIDTGIDYDHVDLGGDGVPRANSPFPGSRIVAGWDFVGDAFNADSSSATYDPTTVPDAYPDDCAGHGTHVAGIIGANGRARGVAPDAQLGAYRVFGCKGSTSADVMIAAMEAALADGMQVVNMSIGSAYQWPQYPTAMAATRLVNLGVVVVASIGNSGANGLWAAGAPGLGEKVIGVASFDNTHAMLNELTISPDGTAIGYTNATAAPPAPYTGTLPMARTGTASSTADACAALPSGSLAGKAALVRRGTCSFYQKALNAQNAGAAAVVLYNNTTGRVSPTVAGAVAITIPVVAVSAAEGALIDSRLAAGSVDLTWTSDLGSFPNSTGNLISDFSSYGLSPDLALKPDLGAPGGYIYSTYPLELGGYASLSGTSMSSPHVAGAVALLLEARPSTPSQRVRTILQNTAEPKLWWRDPTLGFLETVGRQGAGMLRIDRAILATTSVEPAKLSLGESQAGPVARTLTVTSSADAPVTYALSFVNALSARGTFSPVFNTSNASVSFGAPTVTVPAQGSATVELTVTPPTGPDKAQYGGYVVLTPSGGGEILRVPYAGFVGDYQSIKVLTPAGAGLPVLAQLVESSYEARPDGGTFTMAGDDVPFVLVHLDHPSRALRLDVTDAASGKAWHTALAEDYLPRNATSAGFFALAWDGTTAAGTRSYVVPNGSYLVTLSVLKALGDPANPSDWERWTSPVVTLARP